MSDPVMKALSDARPPTAADDAWAYSAQGATSLAMVHQRITQETVRPTSRRPRAAVLLGVGVLTVGAAGSLAFTVLQTREPVSPQTVVCNQTASPGSDGAIVSLSSTGPDAAITACSTRWSELWPTTPEPTGFAYCVYPASQGNEGGAGVVIPASGTQSNVTSCRAAGFDVATQ